MTDEQLRQAIIDVLTEVGGDVTEVPDATSEELSTPAAVTMPLYVANKYKKTTLQSIITVVQSASLATISQAEFNAIFN